MTLVTLDRTLDCAIACRKALHTAYRDNPDLRDGVVNLTDEEAIATVEAIIESLGNAVARYSIEVAKSFVRYFRATAPHLRGLAELYDDLTRNERTG